MFTPESFAVFPDARDAYHNKRRDNKKYSGNNKPHNLRDSHFITSF